MILEPTNHLANANTSASISSGSPPQEGNTMRKIKITAANKKHFDSLIRDFRNNGFMLVTYGRRLAELETETEFVIIEY